MKMLIAVGTALVVLLTALAALVSWQVYRPDLLFNPIVQKVRAGPDAKRWGDITILTPEPFKVGDARATVINLMENTGFTAAPQRTYEKILQIDYPLDFFPLDFLEEPSLAQVIYRREINTLVCNVHLYVYLTFDDGDRLTEAIATRQVDVCL